MNIQETAQHFTSNWIRRYFSDTADVHSFYEYLPCCKGVFTRRANQLDTLGSVGPSRDKLTEVVTSFHEPELMHSKIKWNLDRLCQSDSLVVVGGHQACLWTGPLYTIYKAITIIQLAQREETHLGRPVIPVFWIAGEDHDWDEVNHVWVYSSPKPTKVRFPAARTSRRLISELLFCSDEMHKWIDGLSQLLPDSIYKHEWVEILKSLASTSVTWTRLFARFLHFLFGKYGLLLVDAADPKLRDLEKPFMDVLLRKNREIQKSVRQTQDKVIAMGYSAVVPDRENFAHLFISKDGNRYPLYFNGETWTSQAFTGELLPVEMANQITRSPHCLSNSVLSRPLMQEYVFSPLAFVGGFSEITYWGLLKDAFKLCGFRMPIVYPRNQVTLISATAEKRMLEFGVSFSGVYTGFGKNKKWLLQKRNEINMSDLFEEAKTQIEQIHERLLTQLEGKLEVNFLESGQVNRNKLIKHLEYIQGYVDNLLFKKYDCELRNWDELYATLFPLGRPQERVYNVINYWNAYGLDWIDELVRSASLLSERGAAYTATIS